MAPSPAASSRVRVNLTSSTDSEHLMNSLSPDSLLPPDEGHRLYLNAVVVTGAVFFLWYICVCFNSVILHRTQCFYSSRTSYFRSLIEFVATIDVIFCSVFLLYHVISLVPGSLNVNQATNRKCYDVSRRMGEWVFNVVFTAGLVALLRHTLLGMLYSSKQEACKCHQGPHNKNRMKSLFSVQSWSTNSWGLTLLVLLLVGPWVTSSSLVDQIPETAGRRLEVCIYSVTVWTILLPITICVTLTSVVLVSGWSAVLTNALKLMTSPMFPSNQSKTSQLHSNQSLSNDSDTFHGYNNFHYDNNEEVAVETGQTTKNKTSSTKNKNGGKFSLFVEMVLCVIILMGISMFAVLVLFGNFYSDTSQILRSQLAITLTSCCQVAVLFLNRDSSTRGLSVSSGDTVI